MSIFFHALAGAVVEVVAVVDDVVGSDDGSELLHATAVSPSASASATATGQIRFLRAIVSRTGDDGTQKRPTLDRRNDARYLEYCKAVEDLRSSGAIHTDGTIGSEAVPFLQAIVDVSPADIVDASRTMLDAVKAGTQPGDEAGVTTRYWAAHC